MVESRFELKPTASVLTGLPRRKSAPQFLLSTHSLKEYDNNSFMFNENKYCSAICFPYSFSLNGSQI